LDALGINLGYFLVQVLNFLIIVFVINAWIVKPVVGLLERRRESIAQGLEDARVAAEARANAEAEAEKVLREATERAESAAKDIKASAEADVVRAREEAKVEVEQEKERVLGDLRGQVAALAMAAAQRLVGDALDEQRQHRLIEEFFSGVKSGKVVMLEDAPVSGARAEVTSALPLTDSEKAQVRQNVLAKLGGEAEISFRVDPNILGGLVIRVGDKVLDGSVSGQLADMAEKLR